ncbi:SDR family oxidoreductase [Iamia sp. SCSIO 61187]|uniref:SDR family oxidoreductase n=1 Tax=Iamia sp. SCSIO 61187 TaxID=2722752 RepID=UPI001C632E95|nr:SDR family oxidoreductase [Iamia sp. SCSIO 61187]QYG94175.1 SDR family oxidoreductase [Iamia sp. SCSIO 61187]
MALTIDLSDQVALVTGGGRGVGRGITDRLRAAGATVAVAGRSVPDGLPGGVTFHAADVRDADAAAPLVASVLERHGRLDLLVNNAGGSPSVAAADASPRFSTRIIELNLLSALHLAHAARAALAEAGGSIVNVASLSGLRPSPGTAAYGAAKAGLVNLTQTLAMEWAPAMRVNAVSAGMVRTELFDEYYGGPEGAAAAEATVPMGRAATPAEVGDAVVFLASPLASYVTGANLAVHGGGEAIALHRVLGH